MCWSSKINQSRWTAKAHSAKLALCDRRPSFASKTGKDGKPLVAASIKHSIQAGSAGAVIPVWLTGSPGLREG